MIIYRFITISLDTKKILGDTMSTQMYLASRLRTTPEAVEDMYFKIPALKTIRVTKVQSIRINYNKYSVYILYTMSIKCLVQNVIGNTLFINFYYINA